MKAMIARAASSLLLLLLPACAALPGQAPPATLDSSATDWLREATAIDAAIAADGTLAAATLEAAGIAVADQSRLNAALGATVRALYTPTVAVRKVVVSVADMGSSLDQSLVDDAAAEPGARVDSLTTARGVNQSDGCPAGITGRFPAGTSRIYATARVTDLRENTYFEMDWIYEGRVLSRLSWRATYAAAAECIWFYVAPEDFPFLPGSYRATLFVNGTASGNADFEILP